MTTKQDVIRVHREHPDWSWVTVARLIGANPAYVRRIASQCELKRAASIRQLGCAAKRAGMTLADIEAWKNPRQSQNGWTLTEDASL